MQPYKAATQPNAAGADAMCAGAVAARPPLITCCFMPGLLFSYFSLRKLEVQAARRGWPHFHRPRRPWIAASPDVEALVSCNTQ